MVGRSMSYTDEQKIGVVPKGNYSKQLERLYAMKISIGSPYSTIYVYDAVRAGKRATLRRERVHTGDTARQARQLALKFKILRQSIEVHYENGKPKTKTVK